MPPALLHHSLPAIAAPPSNNIYWNRCGAGGARVVDAHLVALPKADSSGNLLAKG